MNKEAHHKDYQDTSPVVTVPESHILANADPRFHGLVLQEPGSPLPYASVRPPAYRATLGDERVHQNDIVTLHTPRLPRKDLVIPSPTELTVGSEMEVLTIGTEVRNNGHERIQPGWTADKLESLLGQQGIPTSPEVWKYMIEVNGAVSALSDNRKDNLRTIAQAMANASDQDENVSFLPLSSQPFIANPADVHPHPYVQRMVMDILTFKAVADLGASYQVHVQMPDLDSGLFATNALRRIPHLTMAMTLNGPFVQHRPSNLLSTREQARRKMPTGGTLPELPDWPGCIDMSVQKLKAGLVPSVPRALSQHRDLRLRPDITPNGTIEVAFSDNPAGLIDKLLMLQELFRLSAWRLYHAYQQDEQLPTSLFDIQSDDQIEWNKKAVEKDGGAAKVTANLNGNRLVSVHDQNMRLLEWISGTDAFIDNPQYPLSTLEQQMRNSLTTPAFTGPASRSMETYYQTGIGTPGHYQQALYSYLHDTKNLSSTEAINRVLVDVSDSYGNYLKSVS